MTGKQEGPYKGEETKAEEDKVWQVDAFVTPYYKKLLCTAFLLWMVWCVFLTQI